MLATKVCRKCGCEKALEDFPFTETKKVGRKHICRACVVEKVKEWTRLNPERSNLNKRKYQNSAKGIEKRRLWLESNNERRRETHKRNEAKRRATVKGNLTCRMATGIGLALKGNKQGRKWESLVGYKLSDLTKHLERNFLPGMTWDNRAEWHIDHKIPLSAFNFSTTEDIDFKRCWSLKNLQPLWVKENCSKQDKLQKPFQPSLAIGGI